MPPASKPTSRRGTVSGTPTGQISGPASQPSSPKPISQPSQSLNAAVQNMRVADPQLPKPSTPGKAGDKLKVLTNFFIINPAQLPEFIYRWNVDIRKKGAQGSQGTIIGRQKRRVLELLLKMDQFNTGCYVDYEKTMWTFEKFITSGAEIFEVDYYDAEESGPRTGNERVVFLVRISSATEGLPSAPLKALLEDPSAKTTIKRPIQEYEDALNNIILRYAGQHEKLSTAARGTKVFPLTSNFPSHSVAKSKNLVGGLKVVRGYARRGKVLEGGTYLNLHVSYSAMYQEGSLADLIKNHQKAHNNDLRALHDFVPHVRVQGKFGSHHVRSIFRLGKNNAEKTTFLCDTHPKTRAPLNQYRSVVWFFQEAYGIRVPANDLVVNVGGRGRDFFWPVSLCYVLPGQAYQGLLPLPQQAQDMIRFACRSPAENKTLIESEGMNMIGVLNRQGSDASVDGTRLQVELSPTEISARRIPSPTINFKNKSYTGKETSKGQWNLQNCIFRGPGRKERAQFTVIALKRPNEPDVVNFMPFVNALEADIKKYCSIGVPATRVQGVGQSVDWPSSDVGNYLKRPLVHCLGKGVRYCFIIPSERGWYPHIKKAADSVGMQTTITLRLRAPKPENTVKASPGEIANLMLKFSMKIGGSNWTLAPQDFEKIIGPDTMLVGIDVVHPPPGSLKGAPSVVGMVSSISSTPSQFTPQLMVQTNPDETKNSMEIVPGLAPLIAKALKRWQGANNGKLPRTIFVCRDGVADQQLQQLLQVELNAMRCGAQQICGHNIPNILLINTQKRHIMRVFQAQGDKSSAFDVKGNPLPGLIVDSQIVSRERDDWYACSHKCLQGQSKPAHHVRVHDELKLSKDVLQQLTHNLSFIFPRSVTSVSIPTPAKLADLLCQRAKTHLHDVYFPNPADRDAGKRYDPNVHFNGDNSIHPALRETMYYI